MNCPHCDHPLAGTVAIGGFRFACEIPHPDCPTPDTEEEPTL